MEKRLYQKELAKKIIFEPLLKIILQPKYKKDRLGWIKLMIHLKNPRLILVGDNDRFIVPKLRNRDLEDLLNILQQYSLLNYEYTLSGEVFKLEINIPKRTSLNSCKVISISKYRKAA